jgi:hypothetical protein
MPVKWSEVQTGRAHDLDGWSGVTDTEVHGQLVNRRYTGVTEVKYEYAVLKGLSDSIPGRSDIKPDNKYAGVEH